MSRGSEYTLYQGRHTNSQQILEEGLNITNHQGNANQNHNEGVPAVAQQKQI